MQNSLVSVIIVNYNGLIWLKKLIPLLMKQNYTNYEIIIVDNNSSDASIKYLSSYKQLRIIHNKTNAGFAEGNNIGIKKAKGRYLILLNNDTEIPNDYISRFVSAFANIPNLAIAQSKIVLLRDNTQIDSCGSFWTSSTFLYHYGCGKKSYLPIYNDSFPVFSVKGASMIIDKKVLNKIGLFDSTFWCYYEETDLCHRVWLSGYECWYFPMVTIKHAVGSTSSTFSSHILQYHNMKNRIRSYLINFEIQNAVKYMFVNFSFTLLLIIVWIIQRKFRLIVAVISAWKWNLINISNTLERRNQIQKLRRINDMDYLRKITKNPHLSYYYHLLNDLSKYDDK